jgi:pimeloyl-ACP methyl ester carboxylesterase
MTALFVHGVPETTVVWQPLVDALDRDDVVLLGLPGFGSPLPDFEPTMQNYAVWLADELATFEDVDLVTHDWGALLALRVLAGKPANVRSWAMDMGDLSPDFQWHDMAKLWQTPDEGEKFMEGFVGASVEDRAALLAATGVPESGALAMAAALDETMAKAILVLYRSATDIGNEWGPGIDQIEGPGLILESMQDPFRNAHRAHRLAERTGAKSAELPDEGHWWMLESPAKAAAILTEFWAGV